MLSPMLEIGGTRRELVTCDSVDEQRDTEKRTILGHLRKGVRILSPPSTMTYKAYD
jgi:hypothetical protein